MNYTYTSNLPIYWKSKRNEKKKKNTHNLNWTINWHTVFTLNSTSYFPLYMSILFQMYQCRFEYRTICYNLHHTHSIIQNDKFEPCVNVTYFPYFSILSSVGHFPSNNSIRSSSCRMIYTQYRNFHFTSVRMLVVCMDLCRCRYPQVVYSPIFFLCYNDPSILH